MNLSIDVPDSYWPRVAASFHGIYGDSQLGNKEIVEYAVTAYLRDNWVSWEQNVNQNAAAPRYNEAAQAYNAARQQVDADIATQNASVIDDAGDAFPGF